MRFLFVLPFVFLTVLCWGNYGPLMHEGQHDMAGSSLRPFICVGFAYFLIAVIVPLLTLQARGEQGKWTLSGAFWSLSAGVVGALGALGVILAFKFKGRPVYVMPLVFGCAPVVNTFVTMLMSRTLKEAKPIFYLGVLLVAGGAAGVLYFKPRKPPIDSGHPPAEAAAATTSTGTAATQPATSAATTQAAPLTPRDQLNIGLAIAVAALSWGAYGPVLHKGQMKMAGSRLRPFLCVGLAYFAMAVVAPLLLLPLLNDAGEWMPGGSVSGILWSLGGGAAGAIGALGIIMAFNFGGKPIFVMPLVFGCAPVVNTFTTILAEQTSAYIQPPFIVSLTLVIIGAVMVLIFAPKPGHAPAHK